MTLFLVIACTGTDSDSGADDDVRGTTIVGATVVDGTGAPPVVTDVRVIGDRVTEIGEIDPPAGDEIVRATDPAATLMDLIREA